MFCVTLIHWMAIYLVDSVSHLWTTGLLLVPTRFYKMRGRWDLQPPKLEGPFVVWEVQSWVVPNSLNFMCIPKTHSNWKPCVLHFYVWNSYMYAFFWWNIGLYLYTQGEGICQNFSALYPGEFVGVWISIWTNFPGFPGVAPRGKPLIDA